MVPPTFGRLYVCALENEPVVLSVFKNPLLPLNWILPLLLTANLVVPLAEASMRSPLLLLFTMRLPLLPMPPLIKSGAFGEETLEPI